MVLSAPVSGRKHYQAGYEDRNLLPDNRCIRTITIKTFKIRMGKTDNKFVFLGIKEITTVLSFNL